MHIAKSVLPLALLAGLLATAPPVESFDRGPKSAEKQMPKPPPHPVVSTPPVVNKPDERITRMEARMKQRDKEIDKRMKQREKETR